jgi:hypothetical protein
LAHLNLTDIRHGAESLAWYIGNGGTDLDVISAQITLLSDRLYLIRQTTTEATKEMVAKG